VKKNLLNIVSGLVKLKTEDEIISCFIQNINTLYPQNGFLFNEKKLKTEDIEVSYNDNIFGYISPSNIELLSENEQEEINESIILLGTIIHSSNNSNQTQKNKLNFLQNLINAIPEPVFYKNAEGKYLGCNQAFEEFVGLSANEIIGKDVYEMSEKEIADKYFEKDKELFDNPGKQSYEWKIINKEGSVKNVKFDKATFAGSNGKPEGIVGVITDITKAKENELKLKYRLEIENVLSNISSYFFEESESKIDESIQYALKTLGEFAGVDRSYVFLFDENNEKMTNTHEWHSPQVKPNKDKFQNVSIELFPWGMNRIIGQDILIINNVLKLSTEVVKEKQNLVKLNIRSVIIVPIIQQKKTIGFLGFNAEIKEKNWDFGDSYALRVVSGLISVALEKHKYISELKDAEYKFRALVEQSLSGIYIIKENKFHYVNPKFAEIFGYTINEIINECAVSDLVHEEDVELVRENLQKRLKGKTEAIHYSFKGRKKDGSIINVDVQGRISSLKGQPVVIGVLLDITERVIIENSLRKLSKAMEQSSASVLVTNSNGFIEYVNPSFTKITGYERDEVINKNPKILKSDLTPKEVYNDLWNTIKTGNNWRGELLNKTKNGELYWEYNSISSIKDDKGKITHFVAVKEDVSNQKKMIEELRLAKETAEKANKLKTEFLAQISHEIRTPVNILLSFSSLIWEEVKGNISKDLEENFTLIKRAGNRIIRTIDLILNLSQIQIGSYELNPKKIDVTKQFKEMIIPEYEYKCGIKGLKLYFNCNLKNVFIHSDEYMFEQIFTNLMDNAIKYTESGQINVVVDKDEKNSVYVDVIDTGIGISKHYLPYLFDVFSQEEQGYTRKFEGTGLGLALVKNYCELNGANISVESEKGKGSKFRVAFLNTTQIKN